MDIKSVKQLAAVMKEFELTRLNVKDGGLEIGMYRMEDGSAAAHNVPEATQAQAPGPTAGPAAAAATAGPAPVEACEEAGEALCAPLVGVAYMAPTPGAAPFVKAGQKVKQGQTLCILEAMKVMNEFPAPRDGVITAVCVENEELVEFGQCLFRIQ